MALFFWHRTSVLGEKLFKKLNLLPWYTSTCHLFLSPFSFPLNMELRNRTQNSCQMHMTMWWCNIISSPRSICAKAETMQICHIYGIMTVFPKMNQFFTACAGLQVITTCLKQYFPKLMISRVNARKCCKELLKISVIYTKTPSHFILFTRGNTAVTYPKADLRSTHTACWGYSALLRVLGPTEEAAVNGTSFSPSNAAGRRLCLIPKCGFTVFCTVATPKVFESWFKRQGLLGEGSFAAVSCAGSCQPRYSGYENCPPNRKNRLRAWCANPFWDLSHSACAGTNQSPEIYCINNFGF